MLRRSPLLAVLALTVACAGNAQNRKDTASSPAGETDRRLEQVVGSTHRSAENKARDKYRHPVETLTFFGIEPDMTVVEISPGAGWYTEILAPYLKANGTYYAAGFDPASKVDYYRKSAAKFQQKLAQDPVNYERVKTTIFAPPAQTDIAPEGSADMVLTFRNVHNWLSAGSADAAFAAFHRALKPGGVLGVVEHRAEAEADPEAIAKSGYVREADVIALAEKAGFELVESSEINANPRDTKDHPKGVWTLPPTLRLGDEDREKYEAIGESDRMTLKFRK